MNAVLLQIDPTQALISPWTQLGVVGSVVLALGWIAYLQWQHIKTLTADHLSDVKACGDRYAEVLIKKSESDNALANAIERIGDRIK